MILEHIYHQIEIMREIQVLGGELVYEDNHLRLQEQVDHRIQAVVAPVVILVLAEEFLVNQVKVLHIDQQCEDNQQLRKY